MARQSSVEKELDDMTECSICIEVFNDPRVLPCIHTFCLKCLLDYGKDSHPGDSMPCPLCTKEFTIPDDGLSGTQKNFFMEKLLHVRRLSAGQEAQQIACDACSSDEASAGETVKPASKYCVQCQQNYCEQCSLYHGKMKISSSHTQLDIGRGSKPEEILKLSVTMCEQRKGKEIEMFCRECNVAACMMCVIMSHSIHDCLDIEKASEDLRKLVLGDTHKVSERWRITEDVLQRLEKERNDVIKHLAGIEDEINTAADKLIAAIQRDKVKLLSEVESIRLKRAQQLETVKQEVEQHMTALESFKTYSEMLSSSGTACDVTRSASSLHDRADELMKFDVIGHVDSSLPPMNVTFTSSTLLGRDERNLVGTVTEGDYNFSSATVTHVIPTHGGNGVGGVTSLGDNVFVVCYDSEQQIEVYDAKTFTLQRHITVPELGGSTYGLAACPYNNCLYASDYDNDSVHRVELSGSNVAVKWSVARHPVGLSVNCEHNLLVVSQNESKLQIFTTDGTLLQDVQLREDIGRPLHAIQLPTGQFLVSRSDSLHQVHSVGVEGAVVRSYGGKMGSQLKQMNKIGGLAVDREGRVLVADSHNNRLLVIDQSVSSAHEMSVCVDGGLEGPRSLWYDQSRRRLYIGEDRRGRVIVIDKLKDFRIN